jgi:ABC-type uncharacterized transport system permease subunit
MHDLLNWVIGHEGALIAGAIFAVNELIAFNPKLESNSILQLVLAGLKKLGGNQEQPK